MVSKLTKSGSPNACLKNMATDEFDRKLGKRIRLYRQSMGMSQTEFGRHLGVSFQQIQKYETGVNRISVNSLRKMASLFGVEPGKLITTTEPEKADKRTMLHMRTYHELPDDLRRLATLIMYVMRRWHKKCESDL